MTEEERQAIVDEITQNVLTALSQNAIDWSANKIEFTSPSAITVATREKVLVPAIDTRENKRIYGNLDLNTLLSAYGLSKASSALSDIESKTEESLEEIDGTTSAKKNELNAIVATGISKIEQTSTSTESGGSNVLTITQTNGTPTQFIVRNGIQGIQGIQGEKGANGEPINTVNFPLTGNSGTVYISANVGKITIGQGFSVIIQSRGGETVWVNVTANDAGFKGYAIRMSNTHGKTAGIWYDQSTGYLYTQQNAWSNLVSFTVIATTFSIRQPTVAQVSSVPSTATQIVITDIALKDDIPTIDTYTKTEIDELIANAGGNSDSAEYALKIPIGTETTNGHTGYIVTNNAEIDAFIETGIVKWAKYTNITNGLPNVDGMMQSIGWRSPVDGSGWGRQIAYDDESHNIYSRYLSNGSWSAWTKVLVNGDALTSVSWGNITDNASCTINTSGTITASKVYGAVYN